MRFKIILLLLVQSITGNILFEKGQDESKFTDEQYQFTENPELHVVKEKLTNAKLIKLEYKTEQQEYMRKEKEPRIKRNLQEGDSNCPMSEEYVAFFSTSVPSSFYIADIKIRESDRMQFVTGTYFYYWAPGWNQCFIAKINTRGGYSDASYIEVPITPTATKVSDCYALALVPKLDQVISVGRISDGSKTSALVIQTDSSLNQLQIIIWSYIADAYNTLNTIEQEAHDVTVSEADGSIYVTGIIYGGGAFMKGNQDCFIIRLDSQLNRIFAKSFGLAGLSLLCSSIQVTRNSDFIYIGGTINTKSLFFAKTDQLADKIIASSLTSNTAIDTLSMRRIILERDNAFSAGSDNNRLFFCGFTSGNNGDMLYGYLLSGTLELVFQYGSPSTETVGMGDCALTHDNQYLFGLLTTNHQVRRAASITEIQTATFMATGINANQGAYSYSVWNCGQTCSTNTQAQMIGPQYGNIRSDCESLVYNAITKYANNYNDYVYSWRACNHYVYDYSTVTCNIAFLNLPNCGTTFSGQQYAQYWSGGCTVQCGPQECTSQFNTMNTNKPWYTSGCPDQELRKNVWESIFTGGGLGASTSSQNYRAQMYCQQSSLSPMPCGGNPSSDQFYWLFDQDCTSDIDNIPLIDYSNWFIFRVPVNSVTFTPINVGSYPDLAVFFGDKSGATVGQALSIDQYGYIYVHGISSATAFGGSGSIKTWLHAKTHFDLAYEVDFNTGLGFGFYPNDYVSPSFFGKKFTIPKQFNNNNLVTDTLGTGVAAFTFSKTFYVNGAPASSLSASSIVLMPNSYAILSNTVAVSGTIYPSFAYSKTLLTTQSLTPLLWGYSFSRMNRLGTLQLYKPIVGANSYLISVEVPQICIQSTYGKNLRIPYLKKSNFIPIPGTNFLSSLGLSLLGGSPTSSRQILSLEGTLDSMSGVTESPYSIYMRGFTESSDVPATFKCLYPNYGFFWNSGTFSSLRRFESTQLIQIIVDDEAVSEPYIVKSIQDVSPVVGQLFSVSIASNFLSCTIFKVRQAKYISQVTPLAYSYQLPYWIQFHELNSTFTMYPPDPTVQTSITVSCCNNIYQCVTSTFLVSPVNNQPISLMPTGGFNQVIQYDSGSGVGQYFQWEMKKTLFYDTDKSSDATDIYKDTDHTVDMTFILPLPTQFQQVQRVGLVYGEGTSTNIGPKIITYSFIDNFPTTAAQPGTLVVIVNSMPQSTTFGNGYVFANIDPTQYLASTYFDKYFPFLVGDNFRPFVLLISPSPSTVPLSPPTEWFTGSTMTYSLTRSDGTIRPGWIEFDQIVGRFEGKPSFADSSELIQLKFTVTDQQQGTCSLFKTLLVNSYPVVRTLFTVLQLGVNRMFTFDVSTLIKDPDRDKVTYSLPVSGDTTSLSNYGISLILNNLYGTPKKTGVIGMITVRCTDVHGNYANAYISIFIKYYEPLIRSNVVTYPNVVINENQRFQFQLNDTLIYDPVEGRTLIFFASTQADLLLPSWINFNPVNNYFYGTAPRASSLIVPLSVQVRAMNLVTHDSIAVVFKVTVIPNFYPQTVPQFLLNNITFQQTDAWFEFTLPDGIFTDKEINYNASTSLTNSNGLPIPSFLNYNPQNQTVYGCNSIVGDYRFNITFTDDQGKQTFANFNLTIAAIPKSNVLTIYVTISSVSFLLFILYFVHLIQYSNAITLSHKVNHKLKDRVREAKKRFDSYKEVEIKYRVNRSDIQFDKVPTTSAVTYDHDFDTNQNHYVTDKSFLERVTEEEIKDYMQTVCTDPRNMQDNPLMKHDITGIESKRPSIFS